MKLTSGIRIGRTTPRSPWKFVAPTFGASQTPSLLAAQSVRIGSLSWKSALPPKLTGGGRVFASDELQKGFIFPAAPGTVGSVPMPALTPLFLGIPAAPPRTLTNASVVPER